MVRSFKWSPGEVMTTDGSPQPIDVDTESQNQAFPGGKVDKNPPVSCEGDMGFIPGPGSSHML